MADSEHDDDFEAYLKRRVPIDQRMKSVDRLEPPPELDRVIIGKARNAIQNSPRVPLYRAPKWALPVGLAATLLIAFSIVLDLGIRASRHQQAESAPAVAQLAAPAASSEPREVAPAPAPAPAQTVPSANARQEIASSGSAASAAAGSSVPAAAAPVASAKTFARMRPPPIKTAPWPPLRRATAQPATGSDASSAEVTTTESVAAYDPRSRSAERRVAETRMRTDDSERVAAAAADVSSAPAPSEAPAPATRVASAAMQAPTTPPPQTLVDATANAAAPQPMQLAASSPKVSAATFDGVKVTEPRSADRLDSLSGGVAARARAPATTPSAGAAADRREHPDPKAWLDQIQKLRVAGLTAQADQELKHFRDAYPAYSTASSDGGVQ